MTEKVDKYLSIFYFNDNILSSPSACRTSRASKNGQIKMTVIDLFNFGVTSLVLIPWGSLGFLGVHWASEFFDEFFCQIFDEFFDAFFYKVYFASTRALALFKGKSLHFL